MARKPKAPKSDDKFNFDDEGKAAPGELAWFDMTESDERGQAMVDAAQQIETSPAEMLRQDLNLLYGSLFEGTQLTNLYQYGGQATRGSMDRGTGVVSESTWNQVRSVITTVSSQVSRSKPRARCVTTAGNWRQQQRAKKLTQLGDGLFSLNRVYEKTQTGFAQAGAWDVVGLESYKGKDRPELAVVRGYELLIDANDGIDANPQTLYRRKFISRKVILKKYGDTEEKKEAIRDAAKEDPTHQGGRTDLIRVYEAWHLPSYKGAGDGRHVVAVKGEGGTLVDEEWTKTYHAIRLFCWDQALSGPYGRSAAEVLLNNQIAINALLDRIARAQHLACVPRVGIQRGSKILKGEITNGIGSVIQFGSMPPVWWSPTALSPEVYQHLERHWAKGFEAYGVSPSLASGQKSAGTVSGEAIRESLDVQTARFAVLSQRWEQLHIDIFRAFVDIAREMYQDDPDRRIAAPGTELLDSIRWKDVDLEEDAYIIEPYPTSLLPTTPQGRIDRVKELVSEGIWSPKRGESALDDLDVEANMSAERSAEKEAEKLCEDMLQDGKYRTPDPAMDLATCLRVGSQYRAAGELGNVPEKHLDQLYKWLDDVAALQAQIKPPAPAPMPGAPGTPSAGMLAPPPAMPMAA
jgi:hypothetical protein